MIKGRLTRNMQKRQMLHFASLVQVHVMVVKNIKIYEEHIMCEGRKWLTIKIVIVNQKI
jgi:hypothetical protein